MLNRLLSQEMTDQIMGIYFSEPKPLHVFLLMEPTENGWVQEMQVFSLFQRTE